MKKNYLFGFLAMATMLFTASCQEENLVGTSNGDTATVTFEVKTPTLTTRAVGDGTTAKKLYVGVYENLNGELKGPLEVSLIDEGETVAFGNDRKATVNLALAKNKEYSVIFWAETENNADAMFDINWDDCKLTLKPSLKANQESYDAFWAQKDVKISNNIEEEVELKRPFAQLNIGTSDKAAAAAAGIVVDRTEVKTKVFTTFNLQNGTAADEAEVTYKMEAIADIEDENFPTDADNQSYLSLNYLLMNADKSIVDVAFSYMDEEDDDAYALNFTSVPVQRNYRTNIYGTLLTNSANYTVEILPGFADDANPDSVHNIKVWDGVSVEEPEIVVNTENPAEPVTAEVSTGAQLAYIAQWLNGGFANNAPATRAGETVDYAKVTIVLNADIDLGGEEWTQIGGFGKHFEGSFDGQGHTISNFKITKKTINQAAFFGSIAGTSTIKNFTIDNAQILYPGVEAEDFYGAAVVGTVYGTHTFENINVNNSTIQGNNKVAGLIAHDGSSNSITITNCHVSDCTIETKNEADGGNVAGLVGYLATKGVVISKSSVKNCVINAVNSADAGKRGNSQFIGAIHGGKSLTITDCVVEGNTFNETGVENYVSPYDTDFIGGAREKSTAPVVINGTLYGALKVNGEYYDNVSDALAAATSGDVIYVGVGSYILPNSLTTEQAGTITFEGYGNASVLQFSSKAGGADGGLNCYADGMTLEFKNLTVVSPNTDSAYSGGFGRAKSVTFENCTYDGQYRSQCPVIFTGCTIDPKTSYIYTDYSDATFTGCTFNCSEGKGIQVYNDGNTSTTTINIENCTFTAAKVGYTWDQKPVTAIDINSNGEKFIVNITNTTATGFGKGLFSDNTLWNIKGGEAYVTVTVNNNIAYPFFTQDETTGEYNVTTAQGIKDVLSLAGAAGAGNTTINIISNIDLTGVEWTPISVDGYHGADIVTINGNNKTITGLSAPLFAGGFAGGSGIVIKNLSIADSKITSKNTQGSGAFVECSDSQDKIYLENCHLLNSSITGSRTGGLVGWTSGYNNVNDGSVKMYVTIKDCSVIGCTISGSSVGGLNGHAGANPWTFTTIENCTVKDCTLQSTDDGDWRVGVAVGTANVGEVTITNLAESGNTLTQTGKTAPTGYKRNYYGRFVPGTTGKLIIDGYEMVADGLGYNAEKKEYAVFTANGLSAANQMMANKTMGQGAKLVLGADIDFTGYTWTPVDSHADTSFWISEINGNGHTLSNLTINGQAMFTRFAGSGNVTVKNITFDKASVNSNGSINTSILTVQTYQNVLLDNVDVKNSTIIGGYKVAPLIATVYNESNSTITATLKNCDVENVTVKATSYDFCTTGMVAFVYAGDNDKIEFENCTVKDVKLYAPNVYSAHAAIYTTGSDTLFNEAEGVIVENVTFENI